MYIFYMTRRRGSLPPEGTSSQSTRSQKMAGTKKTEAKGKKRARQGSSEEEDFSPDTLGSLIYQLGIAMLSLKQHMGPGLAKYIGTHEQELKKIYEGLNALTELSSPLEKITQATQTDIVVAESDLEQILAKELEEDELLDLLPRKWPNFLREKLKSVTELPSEVGDTCSISDINKMNTGEDTETRRPRYKAGEILRDELTIIGDNLFDVRKCKYKIFYDSSDSDKVTMGVVLRAIKKIIAQSSNVSFILPNNNIGNYAKKIISYLARDRQEPVKVLTMHTVGRAAQTRPGQSQIKRATPPAEDSRTVVVKAAGKSYAELLRTMKSAVDSDEAKDVISLRKGRNEELYVRIQGAQKAADFTNILRDKAADLQVDLRRRAGRRTVVHIRDIEHDTSEDEILAAVMARVEDKDQTRISSVRPGYAETQNVTVVTTHRSACKLVEQRIRIGWVNCRAFIREEEDKCFRCWGSGHRRQDCKGPDRMDLCFNCGGRGHKIVDCREPKNCLNCGSQDHRTGAWACTSNSNA